MSKTHTSGKENQLVIILSGTNLSEINFANCCALSDSDLKSIAEMCRGMTAIHLFNCKKISDIGLAAIASNCPDLRYINFARCDKITKEGLITLGSGCPKLETAEFDMEKIKLSDKYCEVLKKKCPNLELVGHVDWSDDLGRKVQLEKTFSLVQKEKKSD